MAFKHRQVEFSRGGRRFSSRRLNCCRETGGLSFIEVLFAMAILLVGVVGIALVFPKAIEAKYQAGDKIRAVLLAQAKAHEIQRDNDTSNTLISSIQNLTVPTAPVVFPEDPNLAYQFCGVSLLDPNDDPAHPDDDPRDDPSVARVIVRYSANSRVKGVIYELRFGR